MSKKTATKRKTPPPPLLDSIRALYQELYDNANALRSQDTEMLGLHDMTYNVPAPQITSIENYTPHTIRSGWTTQAIERFVAMVGDPVVSHDPGISTASHKQSERIEGFLNTLWGALQAVYGTFWPESKEDVGKLGRAFVEVLPYRRRWTSQEGYPQQGEGIDDEGVDIPEDEAAEPYNKRAETWKKTVLPPISMRHLPADSVYTVRTERYRVLQAVRKVEISLAEAARRWEGRFRDALNTPAGGKPTDKVECYEYVDEIWVATFASYHDQAEFVKPPWKHGMKMCPWVLVEGKTTANSDWRRWRPVLFAIKDVGVTMDSQLTRTAMITEIYPLPQPVLRIEEEIPRDPKKVKRRLTLNPPDALILYGKEEFDIKNWEDHSPATEALWAKLDVSMSKVLPDVGHDIATGASDTAAWTWRLRGAQVDQDMQPVVNNMSLGFKRIMQAVCRAIMSPIINETVYVRREGKDGYETISLSPKDIAGQFNNINVSIHVDRLIDRNSDLGAMQMARDLGMAKKWYYEHIGKFENPQEMIEEEILETIEMSEPYLTTLQQDIMEEAGIIEANEAEMSPEELALIWDRLPPGVKAAYMQDQGLGPDGQPLEGGGPDTAMPGLGTTGVPDGASKTALTRTGLTTARQGGATPYAERPGGPTI